MDDGTSTSSSVDNDNDDDLQCLALDDIMSVARDMQNRKGRDGAKAVEDRLFKEYFGVSADVILIVWELLRKHDLITKKGEINHLLWTLVFLKVYPKQGPVCSLVGGTKGAVDPKTFRKWVWKFILNIELLDEVVVSLNYYSPKYRDMICL